MGGYLVELLATLRREQDRFNGKRPFGNSSWKCDLHKPLIRVGLIRGSFDEDGYLEDCDCAAGDNLILAAIQALGSRP